MPQRIAIIGAGITGLSLAQALRDNFTITIFEKSRGVGGRMSSRYAAPYFFDHGTQFFTARHPDFQTWLEPYITNQIVQPWRGQIHNRQDIKTEPYFVAAPNMNSLCKIMAADFDVRCNIEIAPLSTRAAAGWHLYDQQGNQQGVFDWVIATAPAAQCQLLLAKQLGDDAPFSQAVMLGCHALMLGFATPMPLDWIAMQPDNPIISWIAVNSSKPSRDPNYPCFVIHAHHDWTAANQDADPAWIKQQLAREFTACTGIAADAASYAEAHRWRYALASMPSQAGYFNAEKKLAAIGDWASASRIEDCWLSAQAMAMTINATL